MAVHVSAYGNQIPVIDEIAKIHHGVAMESLSVAGNHMREASRSSLKKSQKTGWGFKVKGNNRVLTYNSRTKKIIGQRYKRSTGDIDNPSNLANFITSTTSDKSMIAVVGGKNKAGKVKKYRDGKATGFIKVPGVSKKTFAILERLNDGGIYKMSQKQQNLLKNTEFEVMENGKMVVKKFLMKHDFSTVRYVARRFMQRGYVFARPKIVESLTSRYEKITGKQVNKIKIQQKKIA